MEWFLPYTVRSALFFALIFGIDNLDECSPRFGSRHICDKPSIVGCHVSPICASTAAELQKA
jgi:hypothetical protein